MPLSLTAVSTTVTNVALNFGFTGEAPEEPKARLQR